MSRGRPNNPTFASSLAAFAFATSSLALRSTSGSANALRGGSPSAISRRATSR
jgi:hypothetical protein